MATGGYADELARSSTARSYTEINDINQLTASSLATALGRRALQLHPKKWVTLLRVQGKHSSRDLRAALLGDWNAPRWWVTAPRYLGALKTIEGTATTEHAARCAAARTAVTQSAKHYRSEAPNHFREVVFQATVVGALAFGLEVAPLTDVDIRIFHGCFVSLLYKFLRRRAYRFEHGRIVAKISTEKAMQLVDLRPLSETWRVGNVRTRGPRRAWRPWWDTLSGIASLLSQLKAGNSGSSTSPIAFSWTLKQLVSAPFLRGWQRRVMEASRADFELAARSTNLSPPDSFPESILSTGLPHESQDGRDARYRCSCPDSGWGADSEPQLRCHRISAHGFRSAMVLDKPECPHCYRRFSSISCARHHVRYQSCQRRRACTARAVHHEVAQTNDLHLPPSPGLQPPVIASPPTEFVSTPVNHVDFRFDGSA